MKKILTLLFLFSYQLNAQIYNPIQTNNKDIINLKSADYLKENTLFIDSLDDYIIGKKERKYIQRKFKELQEEFNTQIIEERFIFNNILDNKLTSIYKELQANNSEIPNLQLFISKEGSANAYTSGDQSIVINLGLFYFLENDAQIASVLAHEISHKILKHSIQTQLKRFKLENSKELRAKAKKIKKGKYKTQNKAFNIFKNTIYELSASNREFELEADKKGYELFKKTSYSKQEYINALKVMAIYDTIKPKGVKDKTYKKYFDLPSQVFQDKWLELEDFSAYNYEHYNEKLEKDSLATHPETENRIAKLQGLYPELNEEKELEEASDSYKEVQRIAEYEIIPNLFFNEEYGIGIYVALYHLQNDKDENYYKNWLGKSFLKVYEARKNYTLNRYLDRIDTKKQSESYQKFLSFMWNLRLEEIKTIADFYTKKD